MLYKTIVLELLQERKELHEQLRQSRMLLPTVNRYADELKSSHESWKERLTQENPDRDLLQIASQAMELAIQDLKDCLPPVSPPEGDRTVAPDELMAFLKTHTQSE